MTTVLVALLAMSTGAPLAAVMEDVYRHTLGTALAKRLDYYSEFLDTTRLDEPDYRASVVNYLRTRRYDSRQLRRWDVSEAGLPAGADVVFREPGFREALRPYIVGTLTNVALLAALVVGWLAQRASRRKAQAVLRAREAALQTSNDRVRDLAGRLIVAQEAERSRLARDLHDDACQEIAGLSVELSRLKNDRAASADRELHKALVCMQQRAAKLAENLRLMSHDTGDVEPIGEAVRLGLFRIVQQAVRNATGHGRARLVEVSLERTDGHLALAVRDHGIGFDVDAARKDGGLGLVSMEERTRLLKGQIDIPFQPRPRHHHLGPGAPVRAPVRGVPSPVARPGALTSMRRSAMLRRAQARLGVAAVLPVLAIALGCRAPAQPAASAPAASAPPAADPLPSWNEGPARAAILEFVRAVTTEGGSEFVPAARRIATFDNDGTLWSEQPIYFQVLFALDRVRAMASGHPEWKTTQPFKAAIEGDMKGVAAGGEKGMMEMLAVTHTGMSIEDFDAVVRQWIATARHPTANVPYTRMTYQPMVEVMTYLRANGFKTFIVSGGGTEFMRPWVEQAYGVPPEQVVGSRGKLKYEVRDGRPALFKLPELELMDDGPGKPVGIAQMIGRRPIAAFGNSDGDFQMLEYVTTGAGRRLGMIVHHTDADREWAYDRGSHVGRLERGLDEARVRGWTLIDMRRDWKVVHPSGG